MKFHKLYDIDKGLIVIYVIFFYFSGCSADLRRNKPYINEFFFKLADESNLEIVRERAEKLEFHWLRKVRICSLIAKLRTRVK